MELVRINRNGSATLKRFRFDMSQGASNEANPPLRQGDTVRVGRSMLAKGSDSWSKNILILFEKSLSVLARILSRF